MKPSLAADRVGGRVVDRRERMEVAVLARSRAPPRSRAASPPSRCRGPAPRAARPSRSRRPCSPRSLALPVADPAEVLAVGDDLQAARVGLVALLARRRSSPASRARRGAPSSPGRRGAAGAARGRRGPRARARPLRAVEAEAERAERLARRLRELPSARSPSARGGLLWRKRSSTPSRSPSLGHDEDVDAVGDVPRAVAQLVAGRVVDARLALGAQAEAGQLLGERLRLAVGEDRAAAR